KLRAFENYVEHAFRTLIRFVQSDGFFGNATRIFDQLQLFNELVSFVLPLSAEGAGIGTLVDLIAGERVGGVARAGRKFGLVDVRAVGRGVPDLLAAEVHAGFSKGDSFHRSQFGIDLQ